MLSKAKRNSKAVIAIIESKTTGLLYIGLVIDDQPYKLWKLNDMSPASIDFCNELMNVYDLGYSIECQLPTVIDNQRQIVPLIYNLNDALEDEAEPLGNLKETVQNTLNKVFPPADVPIFSDYDAEKAIIADKCGISEDFLDKAKENADDSPVMFVEQKIEEEPVSNEPVPMEDEYFSVPEQHDSETIDEEIAVPEEWMETAPVPVSPAVSPTKPKTIIHPVSDTPVAPASINQNMIRSCTFDFENTDPESEIRTEGLEEEDTFDINITPVMGIPVQPQPHVEEPVPAPAPVPASDPMPESKPAPAIEEMVTCINGHSTPKKSKFCIHCGARMEPPEKEDLSEIDIVPDKPSENGFLSSYLKNKK